MSSDSRCHSRRLGSFGAITDHDHIGAWRWARSNALSVQGAERAEIRTQDHEAMSAADRTGLSLVAHGRHHDGLRTDTPGLGRGWEPYVRSTPAVTNHYGRRPALTAPSGPRPPTQAAAGDITRIRSRRGVRPYRGRSGEPSVTLPPPSWPIRQSRCLSDLSRRHPDRVRSYRSQSILPC